MSAQSKFLTPHDLMTIATGVGFKVVDQHKSYYGGSTFLTLQKPN